LKGLLSLFQVPEDKSADVLRILDKVDKEHASVLLEELGRHGLSSATARELHQLISGKRSTDDTLRLLSERGGRDALFDAGVEELNSIVAAIRQFGVPSSAFSIDLGVVRGLDYYTGTIYETTLVDYPELGSICSGGRYDDLASFFTETRLPGVGISIGLTRLFAKLKEIGLLKPIGKTPAQVLVTTMDRQHLNDYLDLARRLREADINTEVYLEDAKLKKQLEYANKKGFQVALIAGENEFSRNSVQVKDLSAQSASDCANDDVVNEVMAILKRAT
jgi:histidyl-tRNA synthetase